VNTKIISNIVPIKLVNIFCKPKYFSKNMKKHIVYITTDANRVYVEAGYCQDISLKLFELQNAANSFMVRGPKFTRIVHTEEFETYEAAERRKNELNSYTRMQQEKLIRRYNPNWLGMHKVDSTIMNKAAAYA
jgi:putative endonuclease